MKYQIDILIGLMQKEISDNCNATIEQQKDYCSAIINNLPDCIATGRVITKYELSETIRDLRISLLYCIRTHRSDLINPLEEQPEIKDNRYFLVFGLLDNQVPFNMAVKTSNVFFKTSDIQRLARENFGEGEYILTSYNELSKAEFEYYNK